MSLVSLAHPAALVAAVALVALAEWARRRAKRRLGAPRAAVAMFATLPEGVRLRVGRWLAPARLAALLAMALAAAGPRVRWQEARDERPAADVLIVLDASSSMAHALPGSFAATRFDAARAAGREFAQGRPEDRVGVVAFARWPRLVCPLTWDHELFADRLAASAVVEVASEEDRTAIGVALAEGAARLAESGMGARVLVLITDGENNCGPIPPEAGAEACAQAGVRVHTIALGGGDARTGGAPDAALLARIAAATGGRAFEAGDRATLEAAWRDIDALERAPVRRVTGLTPRPIGSWLLAAGLLSWLALSWLERGPARVMA